MGLKCSKFKDVFAPGSIANLGAAFDCLGVAIGSFGDRVRAEFIPGDEVVIRRMSGLCSDIYNDAKLNTASVAVKAMLSAAGLKVGIALSIKKGIPPGSGLGSSAASAAAAVVAVNELARLGYDRHELVRFAMEGERASAGVAHADNVAPAILGGVVLVRSGVDLDIVELPVPKSLRFIIARPDYRLDTRDSRAALPRSVPLKVAAKQWANVAGIVAGLYSGEVDLFARSMEDLIVEPARSRLIPHFDIIKAVAFDAGALACTISGSGPTIFAVASGEPAARKVERSLSKITKTLHPKFHLTISRPDLKGARLI